MTASKTPTSSNNRQAAAKHSAPVVPMEEAQAPREIQGELLGFQVAGAHRARLRVPARPIIRVEWEDRLYLRARRDNRIEAETKIHYHAPKDGEDEAHSLPDACTLAEQFCFNLDLLMIKWMALNPDNKERFAEEAATLAKHYVDRATSIFQTFVLSIPDAMHLVRAVELYTNNLATIEDLMDALLCFSLPAEQENSAARLRAAGTPAVYDVRLDRSISGQAVLRRRKDGQSPTTMLEVDKVNPGRYDSSPAGEVTLELLAHALRIKPQALSSRIKNSMHRLRRRGELQIA